MKLVNRGFIIVHPTNQFLEWANTFDAEFSFDSSDEMEPNSYLITEDFLEVEPLIEQHFKKIFKNELSMITENEEDWPEDLSFSQFSQWFVIAIGSTVFDLEKTDLISQKL